MSGEDDNNNTIVLTDDQLIEKMEEFFISFRSNNGKAYYHNMIKAIASGEKSTMEINFDDFSNDTNMINMFLYDYDKMMECFEKTVVAQVKKLESDFDERIPIRIKNYSIVSPLRNINAKNTGDFVSIKGMVIQASVPSSIPIMATFTCDFGHDLTLQAKYDYTMDIPKRCMVDGCKAELRLNAKKSKFIDYQILTVQEMQDETPEGQLPSVIDVFLVDDLIGYSRMGEEIILNGIIRPELSAEISLGKKVQTYKQRLYCNNIEIVNQDEVELSLNDEDQKKIKKLLHDNSPEEFRKILIDAFASKIYGHELIKEALLLCMIGSDRLILSDKSVLRGDINMLLVGDPGQGKSELAQIIKRVAQKAFYASGKGSTGAGLTAATLKDQDTGMYVLKPGVTVLADQGIAIIDEFDKMKPEDRSALHEVMEQQTISISKGGITATLNARCSVIGIANPIGGRYDSTMEFTKNLHIPIPLLTRFDLIFVLKDVYNDEKDAKLARYVLESHNPQKQQSKLITTKMDTNLLKKYLKMTQVIKPKITKSTIDILVAEYRDKRKKSDADDIPITPRQLLSIKRLTIAVAKMMMHEETTDDDARHAIDIMMESLKTYAINEETGEVDYGTGEGKPRGTTDKLNTMRRIYNDLYEKNKPMGVSEDEMAKEMVITEKWHDEEEAKMYIDKIRSDWYFIKDNLLYKI